MESHRVAVPKRKRPRTRAIAIVFAAAATAFTLHTCIPADTRPPGPQSGTEEESSRPPPAVPRVPGCSPAEFEPVQKQKSPSEELLDALRAEFPIEAFDCPLVPRGWNRDVPVTEDLSPVHRFIRSELKRQMEQIASRSLLVSEHCSPGNIDEYSKSAFQQGKPPWSVYTDANNEDIMAMGSNACVSVRMSRYIDFPGSSDVEAPAIYNDRASMKAMVRFLHARLRAAGADWGLSDAYRELSDDSIVQDSQFEPDFTCLARIELSRKLLSDGFFQLENMVLANPSSSNEILEGLDNELRGDVRDSVLLRLFVSDNPAASMNEYLDSMDENELAEALERYEHLVASTAYYAIERSRDLAQIEALSKTTTNPAVRDAMSRLAGKLAATFGDDRATGQDQDSPKQDGRYDSDQD